MAKIRLQIVLEIEEKEFLKKMAKGQGISIAEAVRRCVNGVRMQKSNTSVTETQEDYDDEPEYGNDDEEIEEDDEYDLTGVPEEAHIDALKHLRFHNPEKRHVKMVLESFMKKWNKQNS